MLSYDSSFIYQFAEKLYKQANGIIATYTILGVLIGGVGAYAGTQNPTVGLVGAVVVGAVGYFVGAQKAFSLKLQAQIALCQVKIEENTRGVAGGALPVAGGRAKTSV